MNSDSNRRDQDNVAAVPVTGNASSRFNLLWLLPLLLIPLLMLAFCHRRTDDRSTAVAPVPADSGTPVVAPASASTRADAVRADVANPFVVNATGPDANKAVLNFDVHTTTPNPAAMGTLSAVVAYLQANPAAHVALTGYTDNSGSAEVNKQLTQKRVDNVKSALTGAGVDASRIATANFGEAYPITDNSNPQARELNRRVEVTLAK